MKEIFANNIGLEFPPLNFSVVSKLDYSSPMILNIILDYMLYGMLNTVRTKSIKCINISMKKTKTLCTGKYTKYLNFFFGQECLGVFLLR